MNNGKILLVGFGPGSQEHMTARARQAIAEADVVIGYSTYIDLVKDLLHGKEVVRKGMTEEIDRCVEAYEKARSGKVVALISSGDVGVYGMAGPTFEVLLQSGWTPASDITVEVVPGSTALSACAALVGAPLTHDFCSISLSDLLTPWPVIARRIDAAGRGDFVIALYNPKSGRRTRQIIEAQRILLQFRKPETPVAVVKSAYRDRQEIQFVSLDRMADCKIGMLTTVLIGNSSTYQRDGLMVTPRGYSNKYDGIVGETKPGEKAGRSLAMGLEGWKACVRKYLSDNGTLRLTEVARYFDTSIGEILSAVAQGNNGPTSDIAGYEAAESGAANINAILGAARHWGLLRAVVRSETGAVSELIIRTADFKQRTHWLSLENEHFHLHIDIDRISRVYWFRLNDTSRGIYFVDARGDAVFKLFLVRQEGKFDDVARRGFDESWSLMNNEAALARQSA